ncbi:hypothetical protein SpCBS45565_g03336 [Spizellomyces sp. 'palustris']|nr:hypothetical protein SpCBS45565_g03336 [Spizellomyces sp. 'palustris']
MTVANSEESIQLFNSYAEEMRKEAHQAVYTDIPQKIQHLRRLMAISPLINSTGISHVHRVSPAKRTAGTERDTSSSKMRRIENDVKRMDEDTNDSVKQLLVEVEDFHSESVPSNASILEIVQLLHPELSNMIDLCGQIKSWLQFNLFYIDDGRTSAKMVHESVIKELVAAEDSALAIADSIQQYFSKRATLVTSCVKHKTVQDFQEAVKELDALEWLHIKSTFNDISLTYVVLFTRITKAWTVLEPCPPVNTPARQT